MPLSLPRSLPPSLPLSLPLSMPAACQQTWGEHRYQLPGGILGAFDLRPSHYLWDGSIDVHVLAESKSSAPLVRDGVLIACEVSAMHGRGSMCQVSETGTD